MENKLYTFKLGVSLKNYEEKPKNYNYIPYEKKELTINEFSELVLRGHIFCHNYKNYSEFNVKDKTTDNFHHTKLVWYDFDKSPITYTQAYEEAIIKPTFSYTTMSNCKEDNRFRFVYLFKEQISTNEEYANRANLLLNLLFTKDTFDKIMTSLDKSCFKTSQQFLGTKPDCLYNINPENVISIEYLNSYFNHNVLNVNCSIKNKPSFCFSFSDNLKIERKLEYSSLNVTSNNIDDITFQSNNTLNQNMPIFQSYADFYNRIVLIDITSKKCHRINNIEDIKKRERTSLVNKEDMTVLVNETLKIYNNTNFIPLLNNFEYAKMTKDVYSYVGNQDIYFVNTYFGKDKKVKKGKRAHSLYYQALVLKNIEPTLRPQDMAANLMWLLYHYYEEPEEITPYKIVQISLNALKCKEDTSNCGKKKYLINKDFNTLTKPEKIKNLGLARKKKRDNEVLPNFDSNLSVAENAKALNKSVGTIYNCLKDNDVEYKNDNEYLEFKKVYNRTSNENRSVRKMAEIAGLNRGKSERYIKRIKSENDI